MNLQEPIPQGELKAFLKAHLKDNHKPYLLPTKKIMALALIHAATVFRPHSFYVDGKLRGSLEQDLVSKGELTPVGKIVLALGAMRRAISDAIPQKAENDAMLLALLWVWNLENREIALGWIGQQQEGLKFLPKHTWVQTRKFIVEGDINVL